MTTKTMMGLNVIAKITVIGSNSDDDNNGNDVFSIMTTTIIIN